ncbi:KdsC family phosphatase [Desulfopila inferna]|uniref:KdsC family phosphatase n=1 Tax=Desulfopila inferna TaxID=468528 RepID=UPI0019631EA4|nr:HAD hydrolase family protein [Desulfopila inferna]MBM9603913.1 HAD hydrolase family protein [Desulfopila inferna]
MSDDCGCMSPGSYPSDCQVTEGLRKMAHDRTEEKLDERIVARAKEIQLLLLDVDGVLTNGILIFSPEGEESKGFHTQDGFGIKLLQEAGIDVGVITARQSKAVTARCSGLKMRYIYQGDTDKLNAYKTILKESGLKPFQIGYMGDDWLDLPLIKRVGFSAAPANGVDEVRQQVHFTARRCGGEGAVREVIDLILKAKGVQQQLLHSYLNR